MHRILIVCTANICRSPMAEGLIRARLEADGLSDQIEVASAGVYAQEGRSASRTGQELLAERGIDISAHRARELEAWDINQSDLILVMEESHRQAIFGRSPENLHKVYLISELVRQHHDIADPYGGTRREYATALNALDEILIQGWDLMLRRLNFY